MTNKSVIIRPSEDGPDEVDVQLDLCAYYRGIVESLPIDGDDKFRLYLEVLVWGSFYIEAALNKTLIMMAEDSVNGILVPEDVVDSLERSNLEKKVTLVLNKLAKDIDQKSYLRRSTLVLFSLRNRLVHPKEKPERTDLAIADPQDIRPAIEAARELESVLEKDMFCVELHVRKAEILEVGAWYETSIFEYYRRKNDA